MVPHYEANWEGYELVWWLHEEGGGNNSHLKWGEGLKRERGTEVIL